MPVFYQDPKIKSGTKSYNDLQDRPLYDDSVTIEWDGDSTGKVTLLDGVFTKVSDLLPEPSDLLGGKLVLSEVGSENEYSLTEECMVDHRSNGLPLLVVNFEECNGEEGSVYIAYGAFTTTLNGNTITVTETGIYFISAVPGGVNLFAKQLSYGSIKKLDPKYLPESIYGTSGTVTLTAANWSDGAYTLTVDDLGENDAIFFTPATKADKTALEDASVFIGAEGQTVTLEADTTPTADITLDYFIVRGA